MITAAMATMIVIAPMTTPTIQPPQQPGPFKFFIIASVFLVLLELVEVVALPVSGGGADSAGVLVEVVVGGVLVEVVRSDSVSFNENGRFQLF